MDTYEGKAVKRCEVDQDTQKLFREGEQVITSRKLFIRKLKYA